MRQRLRFKVKIRYPQKKRSFLPNYSSDASSADEGHVELSFQRISCDLVVFVLVGLVGSLALPSMVLTFDDGLLFFLFVYHNMI
jgi:hypothetical protein